MSIIPVTFELAPFERAASPFSICPDVSFRANIVTGIQIPDRPPIAMPSEWATTDHRTTEQISMPENIARRLANLAESHLKGQFASFDCFSALGFLAGWDSVVTYGIGRIYDGEETQPDSTEPFKPHVIRNDFLGGEVHALLAIDQRRSFSIDGLSGPPIIADNEALMQVYGGTSIVEVTSVASPFRARLAELDLVERETDAAIDYARSLLELSERLAEANRQAEDARSALDSLNRKIIESQEG